MLHHRGSVFTRVGFMDVSHSVVTIRKKTKQTSYYIFSIFLIIAFITLLPSVNDVCQISKIINAAIVHWNTEASRVYKQPSLLLVTYENVIEAILLPCWFSPLLSPLALASE